MIIDCDIHNELPSDEVLTNYLPEQWVRHLRLFGRRTHSGAEYPTANRNAARVDSWPPNGGPPGSDLTFLCEQLLDCWNIQFGILNPVVGVAEQLNLEYASALCQAVNDWQLSEWLTKDSRFRASIVVPYEDGDLASAEIARMSGHSGFVQILALARTKEPIGRRKYWKIFEAAEHHGLPVGIHFGGAGGHPTTGAGFPSFYLEDHTGMPTVFQDQITNLIFEGVFEQFPRLKIVIIEGGFGWLLPLMWRLDRGWTMLRAEVPRVTRLPSEYVRNHLWVTTQPMEEPSRGRYLAELLEELDMNDRFMFATDYPHWDFDSPAGAIPNVLPQDLRRRLMYTNASELYGLGVDDAVAR